MKKVTDVRSFQAKCWAKLYDGMLDKMLEEFEYDGKNTIISFERDKSPGCMRLSHQNYHTALIQKDDYVRMITLTPFITTKSSSSSSSFKVNTLPEIKIPEFTKRGFIIGGNCYEVVNKLREANGWYITLSKTGDLTLSMKTNSGGKLMIYNDHEKGLIATIGKKKVGIGAFLKALTGLDFQTLKDTVGIYNDITEKTFGEDIQKDYKTLEECQRAVFNLYARQFEINKATNLSGIDIQNEMEKKIAGIDLGLDGLRRYKKFVSFQRRAEGTTLAKDVQLSDNTVMSAGTLLSRNELVRLDSETSLTNIRVSYGSGVYEIKKFGDVENVKGFDADMLFNITSIAVCLFSGLGKIDNRDSYENRVVENVALHITNALKNILIDNVCKPVDNKGGDKVSVFAERFSELDKVSNALVSLCKSESSVQLKDDVNIISEVAKATKLSYVKSSKETKPGMAIRNIQVDQYMRVCPIDTPEGQEVGLNIYLTPTASIDECGFLTAKYLKVENGVATEEVNLNVLDEAGIPIALWDQDLTQPEVKVHIDGEFTTAPSALVKYQDTSPTGILSHSTGYVPYIGNNKSKRALMAANMNKQAVETFGSHRPIVTTANDNLTDLGLYRANKIVEEWAQTYHIQLEEGEEDDVEITLISIDPYKPIDSKVKFTESMRTLTFHTNHPKFVGASDTYKIDLEFYKSSMSGSYSLYRLNTKKTTYKGEDIVYTHRDVRSDDLECGELPNMGSGLTLTKDRVNEFGYGLGMDLKILFKCYEGYTYEDAVVLNKDLFDNKSLTSPSVIEYTMECKDIASQGLEEVFTRSGDLTKLETLYLTSEGIPALGYFVQGGQALICKEVSHYAVNPSGRKTYLGNPHTSILRMDDNKEGYVVGSYIIENGPVKTAVVQIAVINTIGEGDKFVGRHGNKGVLAKVVPREDMPVLEDGSIPDMILNPLGIIARGNIGQLLEHLAGGLGYKLQKRMVVPNLATGNYDELQKLAETLQKEYGFGPQRVYDGKTGLSYEKPMFLGVMHMYKLLHTSHRLYKTIGSAGSNTQAFNNQPKNGQKISELSELSYIAHGATEVLDSLTSAQSDDIDSIGRLKKNILHGGSSVDNRSGVDLVSDNKSDQLLRALLRAQSIDIVSVPNGGVKFKALTDEDIMNIVGNDTNKCLKANPSFTFEQLESLLHNKAIVGDEDGKEANKPRNRKQLRSLYSYFELNTTVIPIIRLRQSYFLKKFPMVEWMFNTTKAKGMYGDKVVLVVSAKVSSLTAEVTTAMLDEKQPGVVVSPSTLSFFRLTNFNKALSEVDSYFDIEIKGENGNVIGTGNSGVQFLTKFLSQLGFNNSVVMDKGNKLKVKSLISEVADAILNYNNETKDKALKTIRAFYEEEYIDNYVQGPENSDYTEKIMSEDDTVPNYSGYEVITPIDKAIANTFNNLKGMSGDVVWDGKKAGVSKMLVMPVALRPRARTATGNKTNLYDMVYIEIMRATLKVLNVRANDLDRASAVSDLYKAMNGMFRRPSGSKEKISLSETLLSSRINKTSTAIRGSIGAKRIDHSSRAVIVVDPKLSLYECGIPFKQCLTMWEDNLIYALTPQLQKSNLSNNTSGGEVSNDVLRKLLRFLISEDYEAIGLSLGATDKHKEVGKAFKDLVADTLDEVLKNELVVLNREPTLHKFNNLAFVPKAVSGLAIHLHPLVCPAYNADFDGDTMAALAVMIESAKRVARETMIAEHNIINPQDGKVMLAPKQDIVLGIYMLTKLKNNTDKELSPTKRYPVSVYEDLSILEEDVDVGFRSIYDYVAYVVRDDAGTRTYVSTAGRLIFNNLFQFGDGFKTTPVPDSDDTLYQLAYDKRINSKTLVGIIVDFFNKHTESALTIQLLDRIKECGIKYSDITGVESSIYDFEDKSSAVQEDVDKVQHKVAKYDMCERLKIFPHQGKKDAVVKMWQDNLETIQGKVADLMDKNSSVYAIIDSGARGSKSDFNTICGVVGQVANIDGTLIEKPVIGNYLKGLRSDEYFTLTYAARNGQISTSLGTATAGTNYRNMSHAMIGLKVTEENCGAEPFEYRLRYGKIDQSVVDSIEDKIITDCEIKFFIGKQIQKRHSMRDTSDTPYVLISDLENTQVHWLEVDGERINLTRELSDDDKSLLFGRVVRKEDLEDDLTPLVKQVQYHNTDSTYEPEYILTSEAIKALEKRPRATIKVRLMLGCETHNGVCSCCVGRDIETRKLIAVGKYIGAIAASSVSQVITQGMMNVHHAKASESGKGNLLLRVKGMLSAKELGNISAHHSQDMGTTYTYTKYDYVKGALTKVGEIENIPTEEEAQLLMGIALTPGVVKIGKNPDINGKVKVYLQKKDEVDESGNPTIIHVYTAYPDEVIVHDGEEVFNNQPLLKNFSYETLLKLNVRNAREYYLHSLLKAFEDSGSGVRAIHFEALCRLQTVYQTVDYKIGHVKYSEPFPSHLTQKEVYDVLCNRNADVDPTQIKITSMSHRLSSQNEMMSATDIISDTFTGDAYRKLGKYIELGKVDPCRNPLSNIYVGRKTNGEPNKSFKQTIDSELEETITAEPIQTPLLDVLTTDEEDDELEGFGGLEYTEEVTYEEPLELDNSIDEDESMEEVEMEHKPSFNFNNFNHSKSYKKPTNNNTSEEPVTTSEESKRILDMERV